MWCLAYSELGFMAQSNSLGVKTSLSQALKLLYLSSVVFSISSLIYGQVLQFYDGQNTVTLRHLDQVRF